MSNVLKKKRITWADFAVPAIVCIIGTRFIYVLSIFVPMKWAAIRSGYWTLGNFTFARKVTHIIYTCANTGLLKSTFIIWLLAILTYLIIRNKFHSHIIWARIIYITGWLLILLLVACLVGDYTTSLIAPNY